MDINNKKQYNQGIGKYKILSSTAGLGTRKKAKYLIIQYLAFSFA